MTIFNVRKLADELHDNKISVDKQFIYLFVTICVERFVSAAENNGSRGVFYLFFPWSYSYSWLEAFKIIYHTAIVLMGVWLVWKANRQGDKKDFFGRYIVLSLPAAIFVNCGGFLIGYNTGFLGVLFGSEFKYWFYLIGMAIVHPIFYAVMIYGMKRASRIA